ncbi:unnamed protein product [Urochloa humidicola]
MAASSDDLADGEPFTPSAFLDLPPTPARSHGEDDESALPADLVLPVIFRMLMEDTDEDELLLNPRPPLAPPSPASLRADPLRRHRRNLLFSTLRSRRRRRRVLPPRRVRWRHLAIRPGGALPAAPIQDMSSWRGTQRRH